MAAIPTLSYSSGFPVHPKLRRKAIECLSETIITFIRLKLESLQKRGCPNVPDRAVFLYTVLPGSLTMDQRTKDNYGHKQAEESAVIDSENRSAVIIEVVHKKRWVFKYRVSTPSTEDAHLLWIAMDATRPLPTLVVVPPPPALPATPKPPLPEPEPVLEGPPPGEPNSPEPAPDTSPPGGSDEKLVPPLPREKRKYKPRQKKPAPVPPPAPPPPHQEKGCSRQKDWTLEESNSFQRAVATTGNYDVRTVRRDYRRHAGADCCNGKTKISTRSPRQGPSRTRFYSNRSDQSRKGTHPLRSQKELLKPLTPP